MPKHTHVTAIAHFSPDSRIHIFRTAIEPTEQFEGVEVDTYVIVTQRYVVVCDTSLCPEIMSTILQTIQRHLAGRILLVVNSHADWDHSWGNNYFSGTHTVPIIAHTDCRTRLLSHEAHTELHEYQQRSSIFRTVELMPPTLTFEQHMTIDGGDLALELLHAPGHCPDQIVVWIAELRVLLAFDAVEKPLPLLGSPEGAPFMFQTLEHFLTLSPQYVYCSHGKSTEPQLIKDNLTYLRTIEQRSRALLAHKYVAAQELQEGATLIGYPFAEAVAGTAADFDAAFYSTAHENNIQNILLWLMQQSQE